MANVTLTMEEYNELQSRMRAAEEDAAAARAALVNNKLADGERFILTTLIRDAMTVVRFAVANLPPEVTRGWPFLSLKRFSENLQHLADHKSDDVSLTAEWMGFVRDCEQHELRRKGLS